MQVKVITPKDQMDYLRLSVFRFEQYEKEGWLDNLDPGMRLLGLDHDCYDHGVHSYIAVFDDNEKIVACQRLIKFPNIFMAVGEYGGLLHPSQIKEASKAAEVSRLAVSDEYKLKVIGQDFPMQTVHHLLAREFYRISRDAGITTIYTATLESIMQAFKSLGFPLQDIGSTVLDNGDKIIMTKFSWSEFERVNAGSDLLGWYQSS